MKTIREKEGREERPFKSERKKMAKNSMIHIYYFKFQTILFFPLAFL